MRPKAKVKTVGSFEAKTHLPRLLAEVEAGARISITRNGRPIAVISRAEPEQQTSPSEAIDQIKEGRKGILLKGIQVDELRKLGRR